MRRHRRFQLDTVDAGWFAVAAALLVRHYPPAAQRREGAAMLGGWLASLGWDEEQIAEFMWVIAENRG